MSSFLVSIASSRSRSSLISASGAYPSAPAWPSPHGVLLFGPPKPFRKTVPSIFSPRTRLQPSSTSGFEENRKLIKSASYLAGGNGAYIENPHPNPLPKGEVVPSPRGRR